MGTWLGPGPMGIGRKGFGGCFNPGWASGTAGFGTGTEGGLGGGTNLGS